ncbi:MAG: Sua5/YciO/YrdC/YwlC family protein [Buchnera aphidicola (Kaburagia rhusicola ensigallis)]
MVNSSSLLECIKRLKNSDVIAYPTESVFGLGCDPNNKNAVEKLLQLKNRKWSKGFILVASCYSQIKSYISEYKLSFYHKNIMSNSWPGPITFLVPAKSSVPYWLTGKSKFLAVRISSHISIRKLCDTFGRAIISTSANRSGLAPCRTHEEVIEQFGKHFPIFYGMLGNNIRPSKIINLMNGKLIRRA